MKIVTSIIFLLMNILNEAQRKNGFFSFFEHGYSKLLRYSSAYLLRVQSKTLITIHQPLYVMKKNEYGQF